MAAWTTNPKQVSLRRPIAWLHMACGVLVGAVFLLMGCTGSLLVFKDQLDLPGYVRTLQPASVSAPVTIDRLLEAAASQFPGTNALLIDLTIPRAAAVYLSRGSWYPSSGVQVAYFDRNDGRFLGSQNYSQGFFNRLLHLHTELFLADRGSYLLGLLALALLTMAVTGYLLWWPGRQRWRRSLRIDWKARWPRRNWDIHTVAGFLGGPFLVLQALTALALTIPLLVLPVIAKLLPGSMNEIAQFDDPPRSTATASAQPAPLQPMLLASERHHPLMHIDSISAPGSVPGVPDDPVIVTMGGKHTLDRGSQARLSFDRYSGKLLRDFDTSQHSILLQTYVLLAPWHFGRIAGLWSQTLWACLGLLPGLLFITGFSMWWRRVPAKYLRGAMAHVLS